MAFKKIGELIDINPANIQAPETVIPVIDTTIMEDFRKFATNLKRIAPKAEDFLYFSAVMMHAAEHSAINDDGTPKLTARGEPVKTSWNKSGGTWKWISNDSKILPYKNSNCFIAGTKILMNDGSVKNIESVNVGDTVITHKGNAKKVISKFITPYNGKMVQLYVSNNEKINCTPEHPFFVARNETKDNNHHRVLQNNKASLLFTEANGLKDTDVLLCPIIKNQVNSDITSNKARIFGLYAAEGNILRRNGEVYGVIFSFGSHEKDNLVEECRTLIKEEYGVNATASCSPSQPTKCSLFVNSKYLANDCLKYVGEYCDQKILSPEIVFGSDTIKTNFIVGWMEGDGHVDKDSGKLVGTTTSPNLANQVRLMMHSLNISNSFYRENPNVSRIDDRIIEGKLSIFRIKVAYNVAKELIASSNKLSFSKDCIDRKKLNFYDDYRFYPLLGKDEYHFVGDVYNLEVEDDHSYIANGVAVHNCDIFPEEELVKAYKKWVGKPLCIDHKSSSVDHVRGFIVDTYYDRNLKRVIALCALDKHNYPDLARKIETGYSNSVSMGTAVERAICFDCGAVARTEQDFCQHMRTKSCYGEINIGLNPLELSIVVNGADPQAKIKHIIAAANTLNAYVEEKEQELKKLAESSYIANIAVSNQDNSENCAKFTINASDFDAFRTDVNKALSDLEKLKCDAIEEKMTQNTNDTAYNQSSGTVAMPESDLPNTDYSDQPPHARFANVKELEEELANIKAMIEKKIANMQQELDKLVVFTTKEEIMSGQKDNMNKQGYFQGGGGLNEPTPGKQKYPVDPTQDRLRDDEDKQMVGQKPFPDVGPVDGMYPGYDSFPTGELERKKMLARAEAEERALRRTAVINKVKETLENSKKEAYFQGGGGVNEPTPGKRKYPVDPLQDQLREKEDKQMVGQKPFPDVGAVDGLHPSPDSAEPSDELKRKEMLRRAGLRARFVKASNADGSQNLANSTWEVFQDDKLLLSKTVDEITDGRTDALYSAVATEAFGKDLIAKVKVLGADKVGSLYKRAQVPPPAPMSGVGGDAGNPSPVPASDGMPPADSAGDTGKEGDPKETAMELATKIRDLSSDLVEAERALHGERAEMGEPMPEAAADDGSSDSKVSTAVLHNMRKELNGALSLAIKEAVAGLNDHAQELNTIVGLYDKGAVNTTNKDYVGSIVEDAITDAKEAVADSFRLLGAFAKYARGTYAIEKRAEEEALNKLAHGDDMGTEHCEPENKEIMGMLGETGGDLAELAMALDSEDGDSSSESDADDVDLVSELLAEDLANMEDEADVAGGSNVSSDSMDAVMVPDAATAAAVTKENPSASVEVKKASTKEERVAMRAKLAADIKWNPVFYEFHPKGNCEPGPLDVKPSDKLEVVENLEEVHEQMLDVALAPPKVRKQAAEIQKLVAEGKLNSKDMDLLVANGVDPAAVKYWKDFYGELGPEGKEFATELVKEHVKAQMEEEKSTYRTKMARAYELTYEMVDRELVSRDRNAISMQVDDIMKLNDQGFESLKKVVAKYAPTMQKTAGRMPQVGLFGSEDASGQGSKSDAELLVEMFANSKSRRMF
jgi:Hom_end-associated Hint/LAGLIDADG-like domain